MGVVIREPYLVLAYRDTRKMFRWVVARAWDRDTAISLCLRPFIIKVVVFCDPLLGSGTAVSVVLDPFIITPLVDSCLRLRQCPWCYSPVATQCCNGRCDALTGATGL